jgi:hypothetical protein
LPAGLSGSTKSAMSGPVPPPSITSKERSRRRLWAGAEVISGGFSNPSRVPSTLRSRRIRNSAIAARMMIWTICEPIGRPFRQRICRRWRPCGFAPM